MNNITQIDTIKFNDGELILQQDSRGNYLLCAIGEIAHKYYYKFNKIEASKLVKAFEMFNDCCLVF